MKNFNSNWDQSKGSWCFCYDNVTQTYLMVNNLTKRSCFKETHAIWCEVINFPQLFALYSLSEATKVANNKSPSLGIFCWIFEFATCSFYQWLVEPAWYSGPGDEAS